MSFIRYNQCLCEEGHLWSSEAYEEEFCPYCKKRAVWKNMSHDTDDEYGLINMEQFLLTKAQHESCNLGPRSFRPASYRIPTEEETEGARTGLGEDDGFQAPSPTPHLLRKAT